MGKPAVGVQLQVQEPLDVHTGHAAYSFMSA